MKNSRKYARTFKRKEHIQGTLSKTLMTREASESFEANVHNIEHVMDMDALIQPIIRRSIFWSPLYLGDNWNEYAPLAFWIVDVLRPKLVAEVGSVSPVSYFSFCQAIERLGFEAKCVAIDTSDSNIQHADSAHFDSLQLYSDQYYGSFSSVMRHQLEDTNLLFNKGTIDLLHLNFLGISDEHIPESIDSWLNTLSDESILLLSGTAIQAKKPRLRGLLSSLERHYPIFELTPGSGLTMIFIGKSLPESLSILLNSNKSVESSQAFRDIFYRVGQSCCDAYSIRLAQRSGTTVLTSEKSLAKTDNDEDSLASKLNAADELAKDLKTEVESLRRELGKRHSEFSALQKEKIQLSKKADELQSFKSKSIAASRKALEASEAAGRSETDAMRKHASVVEEELLRSRKTVGDQLLKVATLEANFSHMGATKERQTKELAVLTKLLLQAEATLEKIQSQPASPVPQTTHGSNQKKSKEDRKTSRLPNLLKVFGGTTRITKKDGGEKFLQAQKLLVDSALFDESWYRERYPEVANSNISPVEHYLTIGASLGYNPSANFDSAHYLEKYKDVASSGMNPLVHYLRFGIGENRKPKAN